MRRERNRSERFTPGPEPFGDPFTSKGQKGCVNVISGIYYHSLPLAGRTVRQARAELEERLNIDPRAMAVVDGVEARADTVLREGQCLNFVRPAGEKGSSLFAHHAELPRTFALTGA